MTFDLLLTSLNKRRHEQTREFRALDDPIVALELSRSQKFDADSGHLTGSGFEAQALQDSIGAGEFRPSARRAQALPSQLGKYLREAGEYGVKGTNIP